MASSQVQIANMALDVIGTRSTIASLSEGSAEANAISRHWDNAVDCVLRAAHWNFARKQAALSVLQDATQGQPVPTPWLYEYAYPSDCLQMRSLVPLIQVQPTPVNQPSTPATLNAYGPPVRFLPSTDLDFSGNPIEVLLTNQAQAIGVYTFRNLNTAMWDALFVQAFAAYLGARVCIPLTGDKAMRMQALQMAQQYANDAQRRDGNEGLTVIDAIPDWMRARGYNSDWAYPYGGYFTYGPESLSLIA